MNFFKNFRDDEAFRTVCLASLSGVALLASFFRWFLDLPYDSAWVAIILSGAPILYGAVKGLVAEFDVTADVLVAIALVAAIILGEYFAAGEVAFIMQLGKVLEDITAGESHKSLLTLIKLTPQNARVRMKDGEKEILAVDVRKGDILVVRPGEVIPVDGEIIW